MYQFIESVYWRNGEMPLLHWHEMRFKETQIQHFGAILFPSLNNFIDKNIPEDWIHNTTYKIRVVYCDKYIAIEVQPYQKKSIDRLFLVRNDTIDYSFKYLERRDLDVMKFPFEKNEEVIIVKNGILTDTTFTNIALYNGLRWETPAEALLEGTQRNSLINQGIIHPATIKATELYQYSLIRLFNAMVDWDNAWELPIAAIIM